MFSLLENETFWQFLWRMEADGSGRLVAYLCSSMERKQGESRPEFLADCSSDRIEFLEGLGSFSIQVNIWYPEDQDFAVVWLVTAVLPLSTQMSPLI